MSADVVVGNVVDAVVVVAAAVDVVVVVGYVNVVVERSMTAGDMSHCLLRRTR